MGAATLFEWWNAIYSVPLLFVLAFLTLTWVASLLGASMGELGGKLGLGSDGAALLESDVGVDMADTAGVELDLGGSSHVDGSGLTGLVKGAFGFLGAGQMPLFMLLQILLLVWGLTGVLLHQTAGATGPTALAWSLPVTTAVTLLTTRGIAALFARYFPPFESSGLSRAEIVGRTGTVVYNVTDEAGTVHVRDGHGTLHRLRARAEAVELEPGQEIVVLGYDPERQVYRVDDASAFVDRD